MHSLTTVLRAEDPEAVAADPALVSVVHWDVFLIFFELVLARTRLDYSDVGERVDGLV